VILPGVVVAGLRRQLHERPGAMVTVDLESQAVTAPDGARHGFEIDPFRKQLMLTGQDEIALTLGYEAQITAFEERQRQEMPWVVPEP
jgi:3-isopropylmalate/(R)-2-methylmalate dehydratase small subunit